MVTHKLKNYIVKKADRYQTHGAIIRVDKKPDDAISVAHQINKDILNRYKLVFIRLKKEVTYYDSMKKIISA